MEGSGFLSLLSFQLAIYMALVWWMQMLLWWKPRSGRRFLPSTSAWEAWTGCPSECHGVGVSLGAHGHLEGAFGELALVKVHLNPHGFYSHSDLRCPSEVSLLTEKWPPRVCAYSSVRSRSHGALWDQLWWQVIYFCTFQVNDQQGSFKG